MLAENPSIDAAGRPGALVNRLLHQPMAALRQAAPDQIAGSGGAALFGIDSERTELRNRRVAFG